MSQRSMNRTPIAPIHWMTAIGVFVGVISGGLMATVAQAQSLNQQLTIHLNSGTRSRERDQADRLLALGKTQAAAGDLAGAIASWQLAQQLYQQLGEMDGLALAYGHLATAYGQQGQVAAQEDALRWQLAATRDQRDFNGQITANNALGRVLAPRLGGTVAAGQLFIEAMDIATSVQSQAGEALTAKNLTWLANSLDQPEQNARQVEMATVPPTEWYANPSSLSLKLGVRGAEWLNQQRYYMATRYHTLAYDLAAQDKNASLQFRVLEDLVMAYRLMGRYDLASDWLDQRLTLARSLSDQSEELATLASLGEINLEIGRAVLAQQYFEQALALAEGLNDTEQAEVLRERLAGFQQP